MQHFAQMTIEELDAAWSNAYAYYLQFQNEEAAATLDAIYSAMKQAVKA